MACRPQPRRRYSLLPHHQTAPAGPVRLACSPRTVLGDAGALREALAADPAAAVAIDQERGWPPLLYACYSRWPQTGPAREPGMAQVVRLLLDAGASPNTSGWGSAPTAAGSCRYERRTR